MDVQSKEFVTYYLSAVKQQLDSGKQLEDIEVDFRLSMLKPLHAKWGLLNCSIFLPLPRARKQLLGGGRSLRL